MNNHSNHNSNTGSDILSKVRKLLALSQSPNQHEAALAAARAQSLMIEYKLTMGDIEVAGTPQTPISETFVTDNMGEFKMLAWKGSILFGIAKLNGCTTLKYPKNRYKVIGRESDRQVVEYLACFLMREIERLAFEDYAKQGFTDKKGRWNWVQSFGFGAVRSILQRMKDEQSRMEQTDVRVTALIRREDAALTDFMSSAYPKLRSLKAPKLRSSDAHRNGVVAGKTIQWHSAVNGANAVPKLGGSR